MKVSFAEAAMPATGILAILAAKGGKLSAFGKLADKAAGGQVSAALKAAEFDAERAKSLDVIAPGKTGLSRIIVFGVGDPAEMTARDAELLGGTIAGVLQSIKAKEAVISTEIAGKNPVAAAEFAALVGSGLRLRSYRFDRYKTKKDDKKQLVKSVQILTAQPDTAKASHGRLAAIASGVHLARDLVNEPANTLYPAEFAKRAAALSKHGLDVEVLGPKQLKKLGMGALLGVAMGSARKARLVVMKWNGGKKDEKPVAFIGKGVTFDTGGISIKPSAGMEDMKGDMGGAACVTGLMSALAQRKAKVNAVGVIGLVENMPGSKAQRPGDVVTSMSGQTIAVLNTDAEGRLVLADALWYTQDKHKPKFMVNLATLTGAILIALGKEHAGLFSNNDELSERLHAMGQETGEKVWRLPLDKAYDKLIDSDIADMKNIGGRLAGSITAAQFLQRFVNDCPWAHLDVAGTAMDSPKTAISQSWASGWGVRLLDRLVSTHYET